MDAHETHDGPVDLAEAHDVDKSTDGEEISNPKGLVAVFSFLFSSMTSRNFNDLRMKKALACDVNMIYVPL